MAQTRTDNEHTITFQARISSRNAITLPPDVRRDLDIHPGDLVEVRIATYRPATAETTPESTISARDTVRNYFRDREDVERFIEEERQGWEERDKLLAEDRKLLWERRRASQS